LKVEELKELATVAMIGTIYQIECFVSYTYNDNKLRNLYF